MIQGIYAGGRNSLGLSKNVGLEMFLLVYIIRTLLFSHRINLTLLEYQEVKLKKNSFLSIL